MKKRVLSVLVAVMLVACMFTSAMAATTGIEVPASLEKGENLEAVITMPAVEGTKAATVQATINFDTTALELKEINVPDVEGGIKNFTAVADANAKGYIGFTFTTADGSNAISLEKDIVATATFAVKEGVEEIKAFEIVKFYIEVIDEATGSGTEIVSAKDAAATTNIKVVIPCEHEWSEWTVVTEATCGDAGLEERTCAKCGVKEERVIEATGEHTWGEWTHTGKVAEGEECKECTMERICSVCGAKETKKHNDNPETGDTMSAVLFLAMAAMFVAGIVTVNKARKHA